jgi:hypothetical protein
VAEWTPVEIVAEEVEGVATEDRVALAFRLNYEPDYRWRGFFEITPWRTSDDTPGSTLERPKVLGVTIRVVVTPESRESQTQWVHDALDGANQQFQSRVIDAQ